MDDCPYSTMSCIPHWSGKCRWRVSRQKTRLERVDSDKQSLSFKWEETLRLGDWPTKVNRVGTSRMLT